MKILILSILITCFLNSCSTNATQTIEGSLYFKLIDPYTMANTDTDMAKLVGYLDQKGALLTKDEMHLKNWYQFLISKKLDQKRAIRIRRNDGEVNLLFVSPADYEKLNNYQLDSLLQKHQVIRIKANIEELAQDAVRVLDCRDLIAVETLTGTTYWSK